MSEPLAHLYALALRTLDAQERRAEALRGRLGPVLAAAALGASLLSGPLVGAAGPSGALGALSMLVAVGGLVVGLTAGFRLLGSRRRISSEFDAGHLMTTLERAGALTDSDRFYTAMIRRLSDRETCNAALIDQLAVEFTAMLCGILVMLCGLALAAIVG